MKVQELLENEGKVMRFNTLEEYNNFLDSSTDDDTYHFEEISSPASNNDDLFDILVEVTNFQHTPGRTNDPARAETPEDLYGDTELEWRVAGYGSGNWDEEINFWFKWGELPLESKTDEHINQTIADDQMNKRG